MSETKLELRSKLVPGDTVNGFSYSFCRILLNKLYSLDQENKIWVYGKERARKEARADHEIMSLTLLAEIIIRHLVDQIKYPSYLGIQPVDRMTPEKFVQFLVITEEFLAIFEKQSEKEFDTEARDTLLNEIEDELASAADPVFGEKAKTILELIEVRYKLISR